MDPSDLKDGGLWSNEALEAAIDFTGEKANPKAALNQTTVLEPKTEREQSEEILASAGMTDEVLAGLATRVGKYLERKLSRDVNTLDKAVVLELAQRDKQLATLERALSTSTAEYGKFKVHVESKLSSLIDSIASLNEKILTLQTSIGERDETIIEISNNLRSQLTEVIRLRQQTENPTGTVVCGEGSFDIMERLESETTKLTDRISSLPKIDSVKIDGHGAISKASKRRLGKLFNTH